MKPELIHLSTNCEVTQVAEVLLSKKPSDKFNNYKVDYLIAMRSSLPSYYNLNENESLIVKGATMEMLSEYIELYFSGTNVGGVAIEFTNQIFNKYTNWNLLDVQAFINYIKNHKPNVFGNKINPNQLIEIAEEYELQKIKQRDIDYHNHKIRERDREFSEPPSEEFLKWLREYQNKKIEKEEKKKIEMEEAQKKKKEDYDKLVEKVKSDYLS